MESQNKKDLLGSLWEVAILGYNFPVTFIFQFTTHVGVAIKSGCGFLPIAGTEGVGPGPGGTAAHPVPPLPGGV